MELRRKEEPKERITLGVEFDRFCATYIYGIVINPTTGNHNVHILNSNYVTESLKVDFYFLPQITVL